MTSLRIVAADDEPIALDRLSDLLTQIEGVELAATATSGREAITRITELQPDLVLLDIEMPTIDGFDVVEALLRQQWSADDSVPLICFVTAYPHFAPDAFETGALDFICKPVRLSRLEKAIGRARAALDQREAASRLQELSEQLDELRRVQAPAEDPPIWIKQRGELVRLEIAALDWIEAEGEYVRLHSNGTTLLLRDSITALAEQLAAHGFIRIHRRYLINQDRLMAIQSNRTGVCSVLQDGTKLPVGRKYRKSVRSLAQATVSRTRSAAVRPR